ncbi:MAG: esterase [Actinobacteria bacterium]|nr:esterase [Actinomycetota bacterium]MBV8396575.1 esterase [Actinomycetota bacterium]MBV8597324.1 esterase [Actinomycetota bacterium]
MRREEADGVLIFGHFGKPLLVFPAQEGSRYEWEERGMVAAVADLIDAGRVKLYCVDSWDSGIWHDEWLPLEERARRHGEYENWLLQHVAPLIHADCGGYQDIATAGVSFGAFHAANLTLRHAEVFPFALCMSGIYDVAGIGWGDRGDAVYFNNPADYVSNLHGEHLAWLIQRAFLVLVVGRGAWEDSTGSLEQTRRFGALLAGKGIPHELDVWGDDSPHDWPAWRAQISHHLGRYA